MGFRWEYMIFCSWWGFGFFAYGMVGVRLLCYVWYGILGYLYSIYSILRCGISGLIQWLY